VRTSELAGRAGVNPETLRYYERRGLMHEPPRTEGGYRNYPDAAVELTMAESLRFVAGLFRNQTPTSCCA
jgi:DNA-binding transcriptional MerR regulator